MKTAEETLRDIIRPDCIWEDHLDNVPMSYIIQIMKEYAKEVAEQALKRAANSLKPDAITTKRIILATKIETP